MRHQEIIELFRRYETEHPIETYRCYDWNVWPLLRTTTAYEALVLPSSPSKLGANHVKEFLKRSRFAWRFTRVARRLQAQCPQKIMGLDPYNSQRPTEPGRDVVILTLSGRRQQVGACLYEIYADPLVEHLERGGVLTLTWERGNERWPRCSPSAWISRLLAAELLKMPRLAPLPRPSWFADFGHFVSSQLGRRVSWAQIEARIQLTQQSSLIFEKWLKPIGAKLLISVCWYDATVMAATLAAKRLGVVSADLQHGLQGGTHMAYSGWVNTPFGGYETVPDVFLSWGEESATRSLADNPAFSAQSTSIVTGNLWFNKWRDGNEENPDNELECLKNKIKIYTKVVLITLQDGFGYEKFVYEAMRRAPGDWAWLVRFHPATSVQERITIEKELSAVPGSRFEVALASNLPLYSLLRLSHIHLTGHSTTALEALGFGIPTITVTDTGAEVFKLYRAMGVMQQASSADDLLQKIRLCENISADTCRRSAEDIFASSNIAADGLDRLLSIAGIEKGV